MISPSEIAEARTVSSQSRSTPSRCAIVAIVSFDDAAFIVAYVRGIAEFQERLHLSQCLVGVGQRGIAHIAIERLKALDRIAFYARPQPLAHDREQIHKPLAPQQLIKLVLARRVAPHQSLQRGGLVGGEMINVQIRMKAQAIHHEVDEPLKSRAFLRARKCPIRHVAFLPVLASEGVAEQIFKPTIANEWVAFKIEKYVPWARLTQLGQTKPWNRL